MSKIIVLDTETLGVFDPSVYDLGYVIYDSETDGIVKARDYITSEIFDDESKMKNCLLRKQIGLFITNA